MLCLATASDVVILTDYNFEHDTQATTGSTTGDWFVLMFAPWCGHCKKVKPIWEELATDLKGQTVKAASIASVDCTENSETCQRFNVKGYPTLLYFSHGKMYKYKGKRNLEGFKAFIDGGYQDVESVDIPGE